MEPVSSTPKVVVVANPVQAAKIQVAADAQGIPKDELVVTTPGQLATKVLLDKAKAKSELAEANLEDMKAAEKANEANEEAIAAAQKEKQAKAEEAQAQEAKRLADEAAAKQFQAEQDAATQKALKEAAEAEEFQRKLEIELQRTQAESMLSSGDQVKFNEGLYLLTLADGGAAKVDQVHGEAVVASSNVQASLDVAESNKIEHQQRLTEKGRLETAAVSDHQSSSEHAELSEIAKKAADALKLGASERRQAAMQLLAESERNSDLAHIGQHVSGGFIVTEPKAPPAKSETKTP